MAHEVESMLYVNATPWHGLGVKLNAPPATVAEALRIAGLDWTVSLEQLQLSDGTAVARYAVLRDTDRSVLGTVGPGYRPMQNAPAFAFFDPYLATGEATIETAGSLRGGARVWMLAKIARPDSVIVAKADDRVAKYLLLAQGHDGAMAIHVGLTPIRVVCHNTLSAAVPSQGKRGGDVSANGMMRIRHVKNAEAMLSQVHATIDAADRNFEKAADFFRSLAGKHIRSAAKLRAYVEAVFPQTRKADKVDAVALMSDVSRDSAKDEIRDQLLDKTQEAKSRVFDEITELFEGGRGNDLPGVKGTAWGAYNAVTEYLTWERGRSADTRLNNLWMGGSGAPQRALTAAANVFLSS